MSRKAINGIEVPSINHIWTTNLGLAKGRQMSPPRASIDIIIFGQTKVTIIFYIIHNTLYYFSRFGREIIQVLWRNFFKGSGFYRTKTYQIRDKNYMNFYHYFL